MAELQARIREAARHAKLQQKAYVHLYAAWRRALAEVRAPGCGAVVGSGGGGGGGDGAMHNRMGGGGGGAGEERGAGEGEGAEGVLGGEDPPLPTALDADAALADAPGLGLGPRGDALGAAVALGVELRAASRALAARLSALRAEPGAGEGAGEVVVAAAEALRRRARGIGAGAASGVTGEVRPVAHYGCSMCARARVCVWGGGRRQQHQLQTDVVCRPQVLSRCLRRTTRSSWCRSAVVVGCRRCPPLPLAGRGRTRHDGRPRCRPSMRTPCFCRCDCMGGACAARGARNASMWCPLPCGLDRTAPCRGVPPPCAMAKTSVRCVLATGCVCE